MLIVGITFQREEDVHSIYKKVCDAIHFNHEMHAISSIFRLPDKSSNRAAVSVEPNASQKPALSYRAILVKFVNSNLSNQFIRSYLRKKTLNLSDIGFLTPSRIFINENLSPVMKKKGGLFSKVSKLYIRRGLVYVQLVGVADPVCIRSLSQLNDVLSYQINNIHAMAILYNGFEI